MAPKAKQTAVTAKTPVAAGAKVPPKAVVANGAAPASAFGGAPASTL
jgi:hypothetical protein